MCINIEINENMQTNTREDQENENFADSLDLGLKGASSEMVQRLKEDEMRKKTQKPSGDNRKNTSGPLADKQFTLRNSYLTDLFEINHIRAIHNIFIVMFFILLLNAATHEYVETGMVYLGLQTIKLAFGNVSDIAIIWTIMIISTLVIYLGFRVWSNQHVKFSQKLIIIKVLDYSSLIVFVLHQIVFIAVPAKFTLEKRLPPAASILVLMEQVRMLMKTHAFVRSNVRRVLTYKSQNKENQGIYFPEFPKFLYFMFAPTLVYGDRYPRTKIIRWKFFFWNFTEVLVTLFYAAFIFECYIIPPFRNYGRRIFEPRIVVLLTLFNTMLPGIILHLFGFYCILHSWQNAMAELLRFGDRLFYKDWWNSKSYSEFYRTWNLLVHDWLHQYIYKDFYILFHSKPYATLMTFVVSAIFHEYILIVAFRFFYPMMFVFMAVYSVIFVSIIKNYSRIQGNIFIWLSIITGQGCLYTFYPMEFYARLNCPPYDDPLLDMLLPRSWICNDVLNGTDNINRD